MLLVIQVLLILLESDLFIRPSGLTRITITYVLHLCTALPSLRLWIHIRRLHVFELLCRIECSLLCTRCRCYPRHQLVDICWVDILWVLLLKHRGLELLLIGDALRIGVAGGGGSTWRAWGVLFHEIGVLLSDVWYGRGEWLVEAGRRVDIVGTAHEVGGLDETWVVYTVEVCMLIAVTNLWIEVWIRCLRL